MHKLIALAALACAAAPVAAIAADTGPERVDVAYEALSEGRTAEAIAQLNGSDAVRSDDPAALINLGTALAREGRVSDARAMFTAAINSSDHYYLELADGRWIDSRKAAKMALDRLDKAQGIALR